MNINVGAKIHNRFDIEVRDAKTNELKQTAVAHNIVLNSIFTRLCAGTTFFTSIAFGRGTGELEPTRTSLFDEIGRKNVGSPSYVYSNDEASYGRKSITLNPEEYVGETITEVGIGSTSALYTHALLTDSEGNPVSITKSDTDVIVIYATIFATVTAPPGVKLVNASDNTLVKYLIGAITFSSDTKYIALGRNPADDLRSYSRFTRTADYLPSRYSVSLTSNLSDCSLILGPARVAISEANFSIRELSLETVFRVVFPCTAAHETYSYEGVSIGIGDGVTKVFFAPSKDILQDSLSIKTDGATNVDLSLATVSQCNSVEGSLGYRSNRTTSRDKLTTLSSYNGVYIKDLLWYSKGQSISGLSTSAGYNSVSNAGDVVCTFGSGAVRTFIFEEDTYVEKTALTIAYVNALYLNGTGNLLLIYRSSSLGGTLFSWNSTTEEWVLVAEGMGLEQGFTSFTPPYLSPWTIDDDVVMFIGGTSAVKALVYASDGVTLKHAVESFDSYSTSKQLHISNDGKLILTVRSSSPSTVATFSLENDEWVERTISITGGVWAVFDYRTIANLSGDAVKTYVLLDGSWYLTDEFSASGAIGTYGYSSDYTTDGSYSSGGTFPSYYYKAFDFKPRNTAIIFDEPPAEGVAITADYTVEGFHKTDQYVLDVGCTIQFAEGSA